MQKKEIRDLIAELLVNGADLHLVRTLFSSILDETNVMSGDKESILEIFDTFWEMELEILKRVEDARRNGARFGGH